MKHVRKNGCPHRFSQWCASVAGTDKCTWNEVPKDEKANLLNALLAEQGSLCAYTMKRIDATSSHIEHIKPQSRCRVDQHGSDVEYWNLVACFPREGMRRTYRYGAQKKGDWWENNGAEFVSPLDPVCETRFSFDLNGKISPVANDPKAKKTIEVLGLDHPTLNEERKRVIEEFIFGQGGNDALSKAAAQRARERVCAHDGQGRFYEFCVAIKHAIQLYLRLLERRARTRVFAHRER